MVTRLRYQDPERASVACTMGAVLRALRNVTAELPFVRLCAEKEPDEARRRQAQNRLRELSGQPSLQPTPPPTAPKNSQSILEEGLGTP
jgi:hypothetical protein